MKALGTSAAKDARITEVRAMAARIAVVLAMGERKARVETARAKKMKVVDKGELEMREVGSWATGVQATVAGGMVEAAMAEVVKGVEPKVVVVMVEAARATEEMAAVKVRRACSGRRMRAC